jgi:hypothetical protein
VTNLFLDILSKHKVDDVVKETSSYENLENRKRQDPKFPNSCSALLFSIDAHDRGFDCSIVRAGIVFLQYNSRCSSGRSFTECDCTRAIVTRRQFQRLAKGVLEDIMEHEVNTQTNQETNNILKPDITEIQVKSEPIRLSGLLKNMSYEEYMRVFNNEVEAFEQLKCNVFINDKIPVLEQTTEELQENIRTLEQIKNIITVIHAKKVKKLQDIIDEADETERKIIRARDKQYVVKPEPPNISKKTQSEHKKAEKKEKDAADVLRALGVPDKLVEEFIIRKKNDPSFDYKTFLKEKM